ncbi:MAG TPA: HIT family protein [Thermoleophilaceae bacterium]|jgi:histidine triad (HIT) family protein
MTNSDCIFCKVLAHEIPAQFLWEEDETAAFMDINPWTRGHALVIPRNHSTDLLEISATDLAATAAGAQRLARLQKERLGCDGVNLLNSCGRAAWQTVFHFHIHSIPRYSGDPLQLPTRPQQATPEELAAVADELRG